MKNYYLNKSSIYAAFIAMYIEDFYIFLLNKILVCNFYKKRLPTKP